MITLSTFSHYRQEKCQYRLGGNAQSCFTQKLVQGLFLSLNRVLTFFLWSTLVNPNLKGTVILTQPTVISCIINSAFPFYNGTQARRVNILLTLSPLPVRSIHAVILQEACDHVPHISEQFLVCTGNTDLSILLNKDTFEPDPIVLTYSRPTLRAKGSWGMIFAHCSRPPETSISHWLTDRYFCSVHIHNVVAKKRDASTDLLQRLHGFFAGIQC